MKIEGIKFDQISSKTVCQECGHPAEVHIEIEGMSFNLCFRCWKKLKKQVNRVFVVED